MKTKLISKILGVGLALGLVFSLGAAFIVPTAAQADQMEWSPVNTPSWDDMVILPASDILDYAVGGDEGDIIYAVLELDSSCTEVGWQDENDVWYSFALVKSTDGGVSWSDITANVAEASSLPDVGTPGVHDDIESLKLVAVAPDDEDWVAVAGYLNTPGPSGAHPKPFVVASQDGGSNFTYAHDLEDSANGSAMLLILDMAVSPKVGSIHNIALAGRAYGGTVPPNHGAVYRLEAGTWLTGGWVDTSFYPGWDDSDSDGLNPQIRSKAVVAVDFSPNFDMDDTIVCMMSSYTDSAWPPIGASLVPFIQEGIFNSDGTWNGEAGFGDAIQIKNDGNLLITESGWRSMGFALPADFDGSEPSDNNIYLYANAFDTITGKVGGYVMISEDGALSMRCGPSGDPLLASIAVYGDAMTCKAMVGVYTGWDDSIGPLIPDPCAGVAVYHTVELDDCCPRWEPACKDPSGTYMAVVSYTPDGEKAYAITSNSWQWSDDSKIRSFGDYIAGSTLDESAFSVSLDDGVSFNQLSLIDTDIDYLSDMAVCPDCSVIYLSTINEAVGTWGEGKNIRYGEHDCLNEGGYSEGWFACDSIWRSYDNGDTWERVYHGDWTDYWETGEILLRLPCDEDTGCCTIYMGIQGTKDMFYSRDCGQCWNKAVNQKLVIQDFAVEMENVVYILDENGKVSKSTQYGRRPSDGVDTGMSSGHSITSCCREGFVVVGSDDGEVSWSDDGGETWNQMDDLPKTDEVTIACAPNCENTIYAAVDNDGSGAVFRGDITTGEWTNMNANVSDYEGIAVGRSDGTLYVLSDSIRVDPDKCLCDRFTSDEGEGIEEYSGVARNLTPCDTACCGTEDWDYLIAGMSTQEWDPERYEAAEWFNKDPNGLKICGCLSKDTNTILWAIDDCWEGYDVIGQEYGLLWSYEDCASKHGPKLTSPANNSIVSCDVCATCAGSPLTFKWERMCLACSYDIEIMDENGNVIAAIEEIEITGNPPSLYWNGAKDYDKLDDCASGHQTPFECGRTYTWHVREANTETGECVHSPWSEAWSFTVEASSENAVKLIAPKQGDTVYQRTGVGFSWTSVYDANKYTFVLSKNADLSGALATAEVTGTAYAYSGTLDYETTYYWQVTAWKGNIMMSQSDIGTFAIAAEEYIPPEPQPTPPPVVNIPPTQHIVPTWIYAVIGIGAALIVVVIVLIVRSRRPS